MWDTHILFPPENLRPLLQTRGNYCQRGNGSGLCAENARAERCGAPSVGVEEGFFLGSPSAFGSNRDLKRGHLLAGGSYCIFDGVAQGGAALLLGENDAR